MGTRKNQSTLTAAEKAAFIAAIKALKANGAYDVFVAQHRTAFLAGVNDPAHGGPAFLPWHREYLRRFERALQQIDPSVSIPYWDWTIDRTTNASIWNANFMGGNGTGPGGRVMTGPFAFSTGEWTLTVLDPGDTDNFLTRAFGAMGALPTQQGVNAAINIVPYDSAPWNRNSSMNTSFRNHLEGIIHNPGHMWVGGSMMAMSSPNDPVFWLHHCNIDRLWAVWQRENPGQNYRPPSGTAGVVNGHGLDDPMPPWNNEASPPTPRDVLDHHALGYTYDDEEEEPPQVVPLTVDAAPFAASIGQAGEVDTYSFVASSQGSYVIETEGSTDVVAALYGPNDANALIAEDDDSGAGQNSRIARDLAPGTYYVRIRHYSSSSTGSYRISVRGSGGPQPGIQTIQINGPAVQGTLSANERDLYTFTVGTPGSHTIETAGSTDCFLTLFGPDSQTTVITQDDDGGPGTNSRIVRNLGAGVYYAQVRHYSPTGTGAYSVSVST